MSYSDPTNSAGLLTLFNERPYEHCKEHDSELLDWKYLLECPACLRAEEKSLETQAQLQRIYEIRQAVREYFEQAGKAAL